MDATKEILLKVLEGGGVFLGYEPCGAPRYRRLAAFRNSTEAGRYVYDPLCVSSPVKVALLLARRGVEKIGMVLRGCEARLLVECFKSRQLERSRLYLHGVRCGGGVDPKRLHGYLGREGRRGEIVSIRDLDKDFEFEFKGGGGIKIRKEEILLERCFDCRVPRDLELDSSEESALEPVRFDRPLSRDAGGPDPMERLVSQCILCFACRSACSGCFCRECIFDVNMRKDLTPWVYHLTRTLHLAGRCTGCGECERACPLDLPVKAIGRRLEESISEKYKHEGAGINTDEKLPMLDWHVDD